jgi:hypothetical protein
MTQTRGRQIPGPGLTHPFKVVSGFVVVELCARGRLMLPAGAGWPGQDRLPSELMDYLQPATSFLGPNTELVPELDEVGIEQALLLIQTQCLTSVGLLRDRIIMVERLGYPLREMAGKTAAGLLGATRERVSTLLNAAR